VIAKDQNIDASERSSRMYFFESSINNHVDDEKWMRNTITSRSFSRTQNKNIHHHQLYSQSLHNSKIERIKEFE
jgi:hypothetical protein